jgi:hypothetical protein
MFEKTAEIQLADINNLNIFKELSAFLQNSIPPSNYTFSPLIPLSPPAQTSLSLLTINKNFKNKLN